MDIKKTTDKLRAACRRLSDNNSTSGKIPIDVVRSRIPSMSKHKFKQPFYPLHSQGTIKLFPVPIKRVEDKADQLIWIGGTIMSHMSWTVGQGRPKATGRPKRVKRESFHVSLDTEMVEWMKDQGTPTEVMSKAMLLYRNFINRGGKPGDITHEYLVSGRKESPKEEHEAFKAWAKEKKEFHFDEAALVFGDKKAETWIQRLDYDLFEEKIISCPKRTHRYYRLRSRR